MGLPKSIIKKYGVTKKAWKVYKSGSYRGKPPKRKSGYGLRKSKIMRSSTMARRRKKKSYRRRSGKLFGFDTANIASSMAYGAGREYVSNLIAPYTAKIPLGGVADEIGMLLAGWAVKKFVGRKVPFIGQIAKAGMTIESARIGEALVKGQLTGGATETSTTGNIF